MPCLHKWPSFLPGHRESTDFAGCGGLLAGLAAHLGRVDLPAGVPTNCCQLATSHPCETLLHILFSASKVSPHMNVGKLRSAVSFLPMGHRGNTESAYN